MCVGGEELGHFAAIKLDGSGPRTLDVDSALPIENWRQEGGRRAASVKVERMGEDIVNSISIHRIQDEEAHLDDIVAVLTNNDKTVRMYSLPQSQETQVLDLPFAMNHSTVSPDGQTLVAVGDFNQAYFFQREIQEEPPQIHKPHNRLTSASIDWTLTAVVNLHISPEPNASAGYFTTAWSPSGNLVAVGSEGGYITVFDINLLTDPDVQDQDAIVAVVPSSRPDFMAPHPGAVRSMMFSPEPWDLLIWAEDQDRICIGDLRTGLKTRQIVKLDPKEEGLRQIAVEDVPGDEVVTMSAPPSRDIDEVEADFIRRYRQLPDNATAVNFATEYIEARRRQRQQRQDAASLRSQMNTAIARERALLEDDPQGLTAREQQILESLRTTRQREEARTSGGIPRSVTYTSSDMFRETGGNSASSTTPNRTGGDSSARPINEILNSVQDSMPELSRTSAASPRPGSSYGTDGPNALPSLSTLQDSGVWGSGQRSSTGLIRLSDGSRLPRRRASVILTPPGTNSSPGTASSTTEAPRPSQPPNPPAGGGGGAEEEDNPWRTIEEHMSLARGPLFESTQQQQQQQQRAAQTASPLPTTTTTNTTRPSEAELQAELAAERARARSLNHQRERLRLLNAAERQAAAVASMSPGPPGPGPSGGPGGGVERSRLPTFSQGGEILLRRAQLAGRYRAGEAGVRTAGLAMSADGRTLWAACEEGIFEIAVRVKERFFWAAVEVR